MKTGLRWALLALLLAVITLGIWAEGNAEATGAPARTLRVFWTGDQALAAGWSFGGADIAEALLARQYPGVKVEYTLVDVSTGADKTTRAAVAAGTPPDVYTDTWVRAATYLRPDYALDLSKYLPAEELADYLPGVLDGVTRGGKVLGLPRPGDAQAMAINLEICREVGFAPANWSTWTIDEFLKLAELVKARYGGKKWATGLFAGNQSGDYLLRNWAASFGAQFFAGGDYSKTAINSQAGRGMMDFFAALTAKGYVRADWVTQVDDDYVLDWANGKLAAAPFFFGWIEPYFQDVEKAGGKRFDYAFVPFPRVPGVQRVGAFYTSGGIVVHQSKDDALNKVASAWASAFNSPEVQLLVWTQAGSRPNRKSVAALVAKPEQYSQIGTVVAANGTYDLAGTSPLYSATRPLFPQALQKLVAKGGTAAGALGWYEAEVNKILAGQ